MTTVYSIAAFERMIDDPIRMRAYSAAIKAAVRPGMVVADLGAGTGIFSLLACRQGARKVFAVEPAEGIEVARMHARRNGLQDRIEFFSDISTNIDLPEKVDLIVSDMRGVLPIYDAHFASIIDARERFLRPDGVLIPGCDWLYAAVVEKANPRKVWDRAACQLDFSSVDSYLANSVAGRKQRQVPVERLLTDPQCWLELDYNKFTSVECEGTIEATVRRSGTAEGIVVWFKTVLYRDLGFSTGPGEPDSVYGMLLLPYPQGVAFTVGQQLEIRLRAVNSAGKQTWIWETSVIGPDGALATRLQQSSFLSRPLTPHRLRKRASSFKPTLNEDGRVHQFALQRFSAGATLGGIAEEIQRAFPERFGTLGEALGAVSDMSERFSS